MENEEFRGVREQLQGGSRVRLFKLEIIEATFIEVPFSQAP